MIRFSGVFFGPNDESYLWSASYTPRFLGTRDDPPVPSYIEDLEVVEEDSYNKIDEDNLVWEKLSTSVLEECERMYWEQMEGEE